MERGRKGESEGGKEGGISFTPHFVIHEKKAAI